MGIAPLDCWLYDSIPPLAWHHVFLRLFYQFGHIYPPVKPYQVCPEPHRGKEFVANGALQLSKRHTPYPVGEVGSML